MQYWLQYVAARVISISIDLLETMHAGRLLVCHDVSSNAESCCPILERAAARWMQRAMMVLVQADSRCEQHAA